MTGDYFLITCEHGGNRIPAPYRSLFHDHDALLASHRSYDVGALRQAREMAQALNAPLFFSIVSRLLVDLNRSIGHRHLYSDISRQLPFAARQEILQRFYLPYRHAIIEKIEQVLTRGGRAIHISCHSFTPDLNGAVRNADVGLLYDPARAAEWQLCHHWRAFMRLQMPAIKVRLNYPYAGISDGLTTALRKQYSNEHYVGIELELNQRQLAPAMRRGSVLRAGVISSLQHAVSALEPP